MQAPQFTIFNRQLQRKRRDLYAKNFSDHNFLLNLASNFIAERLLENPTQQKSYENVLNLGCYDGTLNNNQEIANICQKIINSDFSYNMASIAKSNTRNSPYTIVCDEELLPFKPNCFDLIISSLALHLVDDLPGTLIQARKSLKKDGMLIIQIPGMATLNELRNCLILAETEIKGGCHARIVPFIDLQQGTMLLQRAGFSKQVVDSEIIKVGYDSCLTLLKDLRNMTQANSLMQQSGYLGKKVLNKTSELYQKKYGTTNNDITATFEIITMTAWL